MALVTRDPALYAELAAELRERRIPSLSLLPGDRIPERVAAVITSEGEAARISHPLVISAPPDSERTAMWAQVAIALAAGGAAGDLVIGIDPGPRPGYALLDGSALVGEGILEAPEEAARLGSHLRRRFPNRPIRFRVGSGDRLARDRIVNALLPLRRPVEIVDEHRTTPRGRRRPRDHIAARAIARTAGRRVAGRALLTITPGEIANLQRLSREGSGGQFTIPRQLAEGVLRGELSFSEALAEGERRYRPPAGPRPRLPAEPS